MKITNTAKGPRGLNTLAGPVMLDPGQSVDVEISKGEAASAAATGWFDIVGAGSADAKSEPAEDDLDALRKEATELGVKVDQRWGAPRLREEIDKALAK